MVRRIKEGRHEAPQLPGIAEAGLAAWRESLLAELPSSVRPYANRIMQALLLRDGPPKGKPDYSKPGKTGTWTTPDEVYTWDADKKKWDFKELPPGAPLDLCGPYVIEVDIIEDAECPPKGDLTPIVRRAIQKAREEATTMDCPSTCLTDGTPFVEVTYKEWDCQDGVASISVQVLVRCDVI